MRRSKEELPEPEAELSDSRARQLGLPELMM